MIDRNMNTDIPESLIIIAGRDTYPHLLAKAAREAGVKRIVAFAFKGETQREIATHVDEVHWMHLGSVRRFLDQLKSTGIQKAVMVGQIAPHNLFHLRKILCFLYLILHSRFEMQ